MHLFKRDKGICAICNKNVHILKKIAKRILVTKGREAYREFAKEHGMPPERKSWYDADHIIPVSLNGGECGLEGYRTLCVPCHKDVTKDLQKILKSQRDEKAAKEKVKKAKALKEKKKNGPKRVVKRSKKSSVRVHED